MKILMVLVLMLVVVGCTSEYVDVTPDGSCTLEACVSACLGGGRSGGSCVDGVCVCTGTNPDGGDASTEVCHNLLDDDGDTFLDCADPDCLGDPGCSECGNDLVEPGEDCEPANGPGECETECGSTGTRGCDGFCRWEDECVPPEETCNDQDDDCDGATDEGVGNCACDIWLDFEAGLGAFTQIPNPDSSLCVLPLEITDGFHGHGVLSYCGDLLVEPDRPLRISTRAMRQASSAYVFYVHNRRQDILMEESGVIRVYDGPLASGMPVGEETPYEAGEWVLLERDVGPEARFFVQGRKVWEGPEYSLSSEEPRLSFYGGHLVLDEICVRYF